MSTVVIIGLVVLAVTNLYCFCLMAYDKNCARKGKWRVPERRLFLSAALFGALGGVLAMSFFRHKTKHLSFQVFFPLMLVVQIGIIGFGLYNFVL